MTLNLYDENGDVVYTDSIPEKDYFPANSVFEEDFCTSLFGGPSGFYADIVEGVDDKGNRLAFSASRLRLLPVAGNSPAASAMSPVPMAPGAVARGTLRRVR